ncbi:MAG: serine hydrolase domain-containing protein [Sandaracinaceae bacterium]
MLSHPAPRPARGSVADGYQPIADAFAAQLLDGSEVGAALSVYRHGEQVVDLHGGLADVATARRWERDTRIVVFSVTKGFAAMALHLLADRGRLEWDAPVATYWPRFAVAGKERMTVRQLVNHVGGLPYLDAPITLAQCTRDTDRELVERAITAQRPAWTPGSAQGYHALTFGLYVRALFEHIAKEPLGEVLRRELFVPLGSDARLGTPASEDARIATLYPPEVGERVAGMARAVVTQPRGTEANVLRGLLERASISRRAFLSPRPGTGGLSEYNRPPARRAALAWASATASADGVARSYLPFAGRGAHDGRTYLSESTLTPVYERQGWSERDLVLGKPLGWSQGFLKEEAHVFSPTRESFGHAGMGGALGWADPVEGIAFGYVMNKMDWRVRSPRALALCRALYSCEPLRDT